ncbi:cytochrome c biogenesis CcdA family protein [Nanoarchaeota archaeon]
MAIDGVTFPIVLATALVDSINPCAIGVLLLLLGVMLRTEKHLLRLSSIYIGVVFLVYTFSGLGLIWFQSFLIQKGFATIMGTIVGIVVIFGGILEVKDYFWYGKGWSLQIPKKYAKLIKEKSENITSGGAIVLGALVAVVELPCTGGPYLAITTLLAKQFDFTAMLYLVIYNIIFVLPLIILTLIVHYGKRVTHLEDWKKDARKWMRLATGIVMIALGIFLIYYYQAGLVL